ncbi:CHAP domain-containing protein [Patescibacteria group bacterium]|nr:CHAP domain-containing protein [Patescibacteria group bacterium]
MAKQIITLPNGQRIHPLDPNYDVYAKQISGTTQSPALTTAPTQTNQTTTEKTPTGLTSLSNKSSFTPRQSPISPTIPIQTPKTVPVSVPTPKTTPTPQIAPVSPPQQELGVKIPDVNALRSGKYREDEIIRSGNSIYLKPGVQARHTSTASTPAQTGVYIPDPSYLKYYKEDELVRKDGRIFTKTGVPARWGQETTPITTEKTPSLVEDLTQFETETGQYAPAEVTPEVSPYQNVFDQYTQQIQELNKPYIDAQQQVMEALTNMPSMKSYMAKVAEEQGIDVAREKVNQMQTVSGEITALMMDLPENIRESTEDVGISTSQLARMQAKELAPLARGLEAVNQNLTLLQNDFNMRTAAVDRIATYAGIDLQDKRELLKTGLGMIEKNMEAQKGLLDKQFELSTNNISSRLASEAAEVEYQRELDKEEKDYLRDLKTEKELIAYKASYTGTDSGLNELLSPTEAAKMNVPYGTTKGQAIEQGIIPGSDLSAEDKIDLEIKLANDFEKYAKEARHAVRAVGVIETGYQEAVAAGLDGSSLNAPSQAVLIGFNKMLDPTSVVRESEYARSGEGQSLWNRISGTWDKLQQGGAGVSQAELQQFYNVSKQLLKGYEEQMMNFARRTETQANNYDLNLENILTPDIIDMMGDGNNETDLLANLKPLTMGYQNLEQLITENPEYYDLANSLIEEYSDDEIMQFIDSIQEDIGFNNDLSTSVNYSTLKKVVAKKDGSDGGQCGRFVNSITNLGVGDSYESKMAKMDIKNPTSEQIKPGMVFTMPYKNYGHIGFIVSNNGDGTVTVKDSNYSLDEKIKTHNIAISKIKGVTYA